MDCGYTDSGLIDWLELADDAALDALPFGVVAMAEDGTVMSYNRAESQLSGLAPANVIGRHFFSQVAPCTNNFMVAHRFKVCHSTLRSIDMVVRWGGEEFLLLLPDTGAAAATRVAERVRAALAATEVAQPDSGGIHFTVSIGVALPASDILSELVG